MEICPGINGKIASTSPLPSEDRNSRMRGTHSVPAQLRRKEGAQQTPASLPRRSGQVTSVRKTRLERNAESLRPGPHLLASYKDRGPAFPTTSCNLLLAAGGRFYTDHALRLP